jgi:hypothetical protein
VRLLTGLAFLVAGDRGLCTSTDEHAEDHRVAYRTPCRRNAYFNLSVAVLYLYNAGNVRQRWVVLSGGIPDTLSVLAAGLRDAGACGLYGTSGWQPAWLPLFRWAGRVYVALGRDATDRAIALARTLGSAGASSSRRPGGCRAVLSEPPFYAPMEFRFVHWLMK